MPRLRLNYKFTVLHVRQKSPIFLSNDLQVISEADNNNENLSVATDNMMNLNSIKAANINEENTMVIINENNAINTKNEISIKERKEMILNTDQIDDRKTSVIAVNEDELRGDALLKLSVTNGKVRRILDTVLGIQSWSFGTKKEPACPDPSQILVISNKNAF